MTPCGTIGRLGDQIFFFFFNFTLVTFGIERVQACKIHYHDKCQVRRKGSLFPKSIKLSLLIPPFRTWPTITSQRLCLRKIYHGYMESSCETERCYYKIPSEVGAVRRFAAERRSSGILAGSRARCF